MLWLIGPVLMCVSLALLISPTKDDPENPDAKQRDWPAIVGCFIGGILAMKLWWALVQLVTPVGKVVKVRAGMEMFSSMMQHQQYQLQNRGTMMMPRRLPIRFGR